MPERNLLGEELATCSTDPRTGFTRDGCCGTHPNDRGRHELCAVMTDEFLSFIDILSALKGEDSHGTAPLGWDIVVYDVTRS